MVWGCIIRGQKGPLIVLDYPGGKGGGINLAWYQNQVLDSALEGFYSELKKRKQHIYFQQDNAPSHRSKSTMICLEQKKIMLFFHPLFSPDLNPIEPVWHELKHILRTH